MIIKVCHFVVNIKCQMSNLKFQTLNKKKVSGYTLLELLIVVSIMILVFVTGFTSYRDYQRRQSLGAVVRLIYADLRLAQEYSIAGKKPDTPSGNVCTTSSLNGYTFHRINSNSYEILATCVGGDVQVKLVDFQNSFSNVSLSTLSGPSSNAIMFRVLGRGTDYAGVVTITLNDTGGSTPPQSLTITESGEIK